MKLKIALLLGGILFLQACKEDTIEKTDGSSGGFHKELNGWNYAGTAKISGINSPAFTLFKLWNGNTFNKKVDVIFQVDDFLEYPTAQSVHRLILNPDGSVFFFGRVNVNVYQSSTLESSSQRIMQVHTIGPLEGDMRMILEQKTNTETLTRVVLPKYNKDQTVIFMTTGDELQASDLSQENGFFSHNFLLKPFYKGDAYPITLDETQGTRHLSAYVEDDGSLTFASLVGVSNNRSLSLFKSLKGLENIDFGSAYKGPIHRAVPKHHIPLEELSAGDANTELSRSLFIRKNNELMMLLGFSNGETRFVEVDRSKYLLKVKKDFVYPPSATAENWLGMSAKNEGTLYTYSKDPFTIMAYSGRGTSSIALPDFKPFKTQEGGVVGLTYSEDRLYLMIFNEYDLYIYTRTL